MSAATIRRYKQIVDAEAKAKAKRLSWGDPGSKCLRRVEAKVWSGGKHRPVVVSVYPDGIVGYRLLGMRREYMRNAADDYREAVRLTVAAERAAKRKARKGSK
jgi:hypothetical protein